MKKFFLTALAACLLTLGACTHKGETKQAEPVKSTGNVAPLLVENVVSTDKQYMYLNYGGDYRHFEVCILMQDYFDSDTEPVIAGVTNIFQVVTAIGKGYDVHVIMTAHTPDTSTVEVYNDFWVEDCNLESDMRYLTFEEAYNRMMESNYPKPHSRHCVLRKEVGTNDCNPQYIFGNSRYQLYVDAVTGEVNSENPVFGPNYRIGTPLGEWP